MYSNVSLLVKGFPHSLHPGGVNGNVASSKVFSTSTKGIAKVAERHNSSA